MVRKYKLNPIDLIFHHETLLSLAKTEYIKRYPSNIRSEKNPFDFCIIYFVINPDKTLKLDFKYPQETRLSMKVVAKNPKGFTPGSVIHNIDTREITKIIIPPYNGKFYFDFIIWVLDITTDGYWMTNLWTLKVCSDLRFYLSKERKNEYSKVGTNLAEKYNQTFILGHVNLNTGKLKSSSGIRRLSRHGWIPTISLLPQPYGEMVRIIESSNDINQINSVVMKLFNDELLKSMLDRWLVASLAKRREKVFSIAITAFLAKDYITPIYLLLPQIEGLITEHIRRRGEIPKEQIKDRFVQFGFIIKGEKFNSLDSSSKCNSKIKEYLIRCSKVKAFSRA